MFFLYKDYGYDGITPIGCFSTVDKAEEFILKGFPELTKVNWEKKATGKLCFQYKYDIPTWELISIEPDKAFNL